MILLAFISFLCFLVPGNAQSHAGDGSPGSGGLVPELSSAQAWMGRPSFSVRVENTLGGTTGVFGISAAPGATTWNGAPVWLDTSQLLFSTPISMGGSAGIPGVGFVDIPLNIPAPSVAMAGRSFWAQAAIFDPVAAPAGVCTSNAIELTLTMRPSVFVGANVGRPSDWWMLDGPNMVLSDTGTVPFNIHGMSSRIGGLDQYMSVFDEGIFHGDSRSGTLQWTKIWNGATGFMEGCELDEERNIVWTLGTDANANYELHGIDVDVTSPGFGTTVAKTSGVGAVGPVQPWSLSPDGKTAAVVKILSDSIYLWDLDPASSTYMQNTAVLDCPAHNNSPLHLVTTVKYSPDGKELVALVQHAGAYNGEVGRYDIAAGTWIDHNSNSFGTQCLGDNSNPQVLFGAAPTGVTIANDGTIYVSGFADRLGPGQGVDGWMGRLDLTSLSGNAVTWTAYTAGTVYDAWRCSLNREGTVIAVGTPSDSNGDIQFIDAHSLTFLGAEVLPGSRNISNITWR